MTNEKTSLLTKQKIADTLKEIIAEKSFSPNNCTTPVTALCYNLMLASLIGDIGVSTFSVLSLIYSFAGRVGGLTP